MSVLSGRTVLVTGAARGIGAATARAAAARGARVALVGLEPDRLADLAGELDGVWFAADVTDQAALDAAVAGTLRAYGRIDAVVANAGVASRGTVAVGDRSAAIRTVEVNLLGVMRTVAATVAPVGDARGYFLLVSSAAAFLALPGMAAYNAAKAGVEAYGTTMRRELAHRGVAVGTAHPSWVDTDLVRDAREDLPGFSAAVARIPRALGGITSVERCAAVFVDAVERRRRRVYVPPVMAVASALRTVINGPVGDLVVRRSGAVSVPAMEERVRALGRGFGRHTAR